MNNMGKILVLVISILFAVVAVLLGVLYDSKRANQLVLTTESTVLPSKEGGVSFETSSGSSQSESISETGVKKDSEVTLEEKKAQELIDAIIIDGQVRSDFTLDEYNIARMAVEELPETLHKQVLKKEILKIEAALTSMGIPH